MRTRAWIAALTGSRQPSPIPERRILSPSFTSISSSASTISSEFPNRDDPWMPQSLSNTPHNITDNLGSSIGANALQDMELGLETQNYYGVNYFNPFELLLNPERVNGVIDENNNNNGALNYDGFVNRSDRFDFLPNPERHNGENNNNNNSMNIVNRDVLNYGRINRTNPFACLIPERVNSLNRDNNNNMNGEYRFDNAEIRQRVEPTMMTVTMSAEEYNRFMFFNQFYYNSNPLL